MIAQKRDITFKKNSMLGQLLNNVMPEKISFRSEKEHCINSDMKGFNLCKRFPRILWQVKCDPGQLSMKL